MNGLSFGNPGLAFAGMRIIESPYAFETLGLYGELPPYSRHRSRRKVKKHWKKTVRTITEPCAYMIKGAIVAHPIIATKLRRQFQ